MLAAASLCLAAPAAPGQVPGTPPLGGSVERERLVLAYAPRVEAGTHVNAVGVGAEAEYRLVSRGTERGGTTLVLTSRAGARGVATGLGIPGSNWTAAGEIGVAVSFGQRHGLPDTIALMRADRAHTVRLVSVVYGATDGTSQRSGRLEYARAGERSLFTLAFENDFLALQRLDRYRTFALRAGYRWMRGRAPVGVGARLILWTGTTEGLGFLGRGETYDLRGQHGGEHSHGILALDLTRGAVRLSVGVDAEPVRTTVQNRFHDLIDDGAIPALDRRGRAYVQLSVNDLGTLY